MLDPSEGYYTLTVENTTGGHLDVSCSGGAGQISETESGYIINVSTSGATWKVEPRNDGTGNRNCRLLINYIMTVVDGALTYTITSVPDTNYRAENMKEADGTTSYDVGETAHHITGDMTVKGNFIHYQRLYITFNGAPTPKAYYTISSPASSGNHSGNSNCYLLVDVGATMSINVECVHEKTIARISDDAHAGYINCSMEDSETYNLTAIDGPTRRLLIQEITYFTVTVSKSTTGGTVSATFGGEGVSRMTSTSSEYKILVDYCSYRIFHSSGDPNPGYLTGLYDKLIIYDGLQQYIFQVNPSEISNDRGYRSYGFKIGSNLITSDGYIEGNTSFSGNCVEFRIITITTGSNAITVNYTVTRASNKGPAFSGVLKKTDSIYTNTVSISGFSAFSFDENVVYVDTGQNITISVTTSTSSYIARVVVTPYNSSSGLPTNIGTGDMAYNQNSVSRGYTFDITDIRAYTITASPVTGGTLSATSSGGRPLITGSGSGPYTIKVAEGAEWSITNYSNSLNNDILTKRYDKMTITDGAQNYTIRVTPNSISNGEGYRVYGFDVSGTLKTADSGTMSSNITVSGNFIPFKVISFGLPADTTNKIMVYYSVTRADDTGPAYSGSIKRYASTFTNKITVSGYSQFTSSLSSLYVDIGQSVTFTAETTTANHMVRVTDIPQGGSESPSLNIDMTNNFVLDSVTIPHSIIFKQVQTRTITASSVTGGAISASGSGGYPLITGSGPYTIKVANGAKWTLADSTSDTYFENGVNVTSNNIFTLVDGAQTYIVTCSVEPPDVATATTGYRVSGFLNGTTLIDGSGSVGSNMDLTGNCIQYYTVLTSSDIIDITTSYEIGSPATYSTHGPSPGYKILVDAGSNVSFGASTNASGKIVRVSDNGGASTNIGTGASGDVAKYIMSEINIPHTLVFSEIVPTVITVSYPSIGGTVIENDGGNPNLVDIDEGKEIRVDPHATWTVTNTTSGADLLLKRHNLLTIIDGAQTYMIDSTLTSLSENDARIYGFIVGEDLVLDGDDGSFEGLESIIITPNVIKTHTVKLSLEGLEKENFTMYDETPNDSWFSGTVSLTDSVLNGKVFIVDDRLSVSPIEITDIQSVDGHLPIHIDDGCDLKLYPDNPTSDRRIYDTPDGGDRIGPINARYGYLLENVKTGHTLDLFLVNIVTVTVSVQEHGRITVSGSVSVVIDDHHEWSFEIAKGATWEVQSPHKMVIDDMGTTYILEGSSLNFRMVFHGFTYDGSKALEATGEVRSDMNIIGHLDSVSTDKTAITIKLSDDHGKVQVMVIDDWYEIEYGTSIDCYVTAGSLISTGDDGELIIGDVTIARPYEVNEGFECSWRLYEGDKEYTAVVVQREDLVAVFSFHPKSYTLTIPDDTHGYRIYEEDTGHEITESRLVTFGTPIIMKAEYGYHIVKAEYEHTDGSGDVMDFTDSLSFSMPAYDVTMAVKTDDRHPLTFDEHNMKVTVNGVRIASGGLIGYDAPVTVSPLEGYTFHSLYYVHGGIKTDITSECEFNMPAEDTSLTALVSKVVSFKHILPIIIGVIILLIVIFIIFFRKGSKHRA